MYKNLIERLRQYAEVNPNGKAGDEIRIDKETLLKSADAIERLSWHSHNWENLCNFWRKEYDELERRMLDMEEKKE